MVTQTAGQSLFFQFRVVYIQHSAFYLLKRELPYKFFNTVMLKIETTEINCYWNGEKSHGQSPVQKLALGYFFDDWGLYLSVMHSMITLV